MKTKTVWGVGYEVDNHTEEFYEMKDEREAREVAYESPTDTWVVSREVTEWVRS